MNSSSIFKAVTAASGILALYIEVLYNMSLKTYIESIFIEEYSYLIVSIGLIIIIILHEYKGINLSRYIDLGRILSSITLTVLSYTLLILSNILDTYIIQFKALSLITLTWAILIIVLDRESLRRIYYPMISLIALTPIPRDVIDPLSNMLSLSTAYLTSLLTGASLIIDEASKTYNLVIQDSMGYLRMFNIAPICGGYISVMSITSIAIIILYIALKSNVDVYKKIIYTTLILASGLAIVYMGNLIRVSLVILISRYISYETALTFFHYTPSILYSSIATLIVMILAFKYFRFEYQSSKAVYPRGPGGASNTLYVVFISSLIIVSIFAYAYPIEAVYCTYTYKYTTMEDLLLNTTNILFGKIGADVKYIVDESALAEALGASIVKRFGIRYNNTFYEGYIEVAESPARYHSWAVCLTVQGYIIESSWNIDIEDNTYTFYRYYKGSRKMMIGYSIYRFPVSIGGERSIAYVRVSIIKGGWAFEKDILDILTRIRSGESSLEPRFNPLVIWIDATIALTIASLAYIIGSLIVKYRRIVSKLYAGA